MLQLLTVLKSPAVIIKAVAITAIVTFIGVIIWKNHSLEEKVTDSAGELATLLEKYNTMELSNKTLEASLMLYQQEQTRVDTILRDLHAELAKREKINSERNNYVADYRKDTSIVKFNLSNGWVWGHDQAASSTKSGLPSDYYSTRARPDPTTAKKASAFDDADALEVVNYNYALYDQLVHEYEALRKVCSKPPINKGG